MGSLFRKVVMNTIDEFDTGNFAWEIISVVNMMTGADPTATEERELHNALFPIVNKFLKEHGMQARPGRKRQVYLVTEAQ